MAEDWLSEFTDFWLKIKLKKIVNDTAMCTVRKHWVMGNIILFRWMTSASRKQNVWDCDSTGFQKFRYACDSLDVTE